MKAASLNIVFILFFDLCYSQSGEFILVRPSVSSIDSIESSNKSRKFEASFTMSVGDDYFPNAGKYKLANPFIYFREGKLFKTEMNYYYSLPDSIVRLVSYSWEGNSAKSVMLSKLFEDNSVILSKYFGNSGKVKNESHDTWSQKSTTWENEVVHVHQFFVYGQNTNRVRVLISWK